MGTKSVTVKAHHYVKDGELDLSQIRLTDITNIEDLEQFTNLKTLSLYSNQISEIKGLETLTNLKQLLLGSNYIKEIKGLGHLNKLQYLNLENNKIEEIKGLEMLTNLKGLYISKNPIWNANERHLISYGNKSAQEFVRYCQEKANKAKELA